MQFLRLKLVAVGLKLSMSLKERYTQEIVPSLQRELGEENPLAVPRVVKIVLNARTGALVSDAKLPEIAAATLTQISGQRPVRTLARKSIASFKIREGQQVGAMVTLRGPRMWDFLEKFLHVTIPRTRDFRGFPVRVVDRQGNCSIGFREHVMFPEIAPDAVDQLHGLQVTIVTTAGTRERGTALLKAFGFPFRQ